MRSYYRSTIWQKTLRVAPNNPGDLLIEEVKYAANLRLFIETLDAQIEELAKQKDEDVTDEQQALERAQDLQETVVEYTKRLKENFEDSKEQGNFLLKQLNTLAVIQQRYATLTPGPCRLTRMMKCSEVIAAN